MLNDTTVHCTKLHYHALYHNVVQYNLQTVPVGAAVVLIQHRDYLPSVVSTALHCTALYSLYCNGIYYSVGEVHQQVEEECPEAAAEGLL